MISLNSSISPTFDGIMETFGVFTILVLGHTCVVHSMFTGLTMDKYLCKPENLRVNLLQSTI